MPCKARRGVQWKGLGFAVALLLLLLWASSPAFSDWQEEWRRAVEGAKKEGELVLFGPHLPMFQKVWEGFQKSFPEIKFTFEPGKGSDHLQRVLAERRARIYRVDLVMGGGSFMHNFPASALDPIPPTLILPEVTDPNAWWGKKLRFNDPEGQYILSFSESVRTATVAYHTKLVNPKDIQAWKDLLSPRWKGKIAGFDPRAIGGGDPFLFFYFSPELGPGFITRLLSEMDVLLTRDLQQGLDWLANGKVDFYLGSALFTLRAKRNGLPVDVLPHSLKEGEVMGLGGVCCMVRLNQTHHPFAAKVFTNWLLSKEGQTTWQKYTETNSLRVDILKSDVHPTFVPREGVNYFAGNSYEYANPKARKEMLRVVEEALRNKESRR